MGLVGIGKPASFFFCKHRIHHHPSPGLLAVPSPLPYPLPKQSPWNMPKHSSYIFTLIPVSVHSIFNNLFLTSRLWKPILKLLREVWIAKQNVKTHFFEIVSLLIHNTFNTIIFYCTRNIISTILGKICCIRELLNLA